MAALRTGAGVALPALVIAALALVATGCALLPFASPITGGPVAQEIAAHQRMWQQQGVRSYSWSVAYSCECPSSAFTVTVVEGVVAKVVDDSGKVIPSNGVWFPLTIDALFAEAARTVQAGGTVEATWDAATGLPVTMFLDRDLRAIDDELSVTVSAFVPA